MYEIYIEGERDVVWVHERVRVLDHTCVSDWQKTNLQFKFLEKLKVVKTGQDNV